jgi:hypothetical protein
MEAPMASRAAADATATTFVCFLIMNALSFSFLKFLKLLGFTTRWYYTSYKGNYGEVGKSKNNGKNR